MANGYAKYSGIGGGTGGGGGGVTSLNGETGAINLIAGTGITVTPVGQNITIAATGAGSGTVTSVALSDGSTIPLYAISGSPVTATGTLTFSLNTQAANTILAGPTTGAAAQPTFRSLVAADLNTLIVPVANGGTSLASLTLNNVILGNGTGAPQFVAPGPSGNVLTSDGTTWNSSTPGTGGTVTSVALTAPALFTVSGSPITTAGTLAITYSGSALPAANGGTGLTATGPSGNFLMSTGSAWVSAAIIGSAAYSLVASTQITTDSSAVTSPGFSTFSNSPSFTFTPAVTGQYKIYCSLPTDAFSTNVQGSTRIFNTSGGAVLLEESQADIFGATQVISTGMVQSNYTLTAGVTYVFDIQAKLTSGTGIIATGSNSPFYMFAEGVGLQNTSSQFPVNMKVIGTGSWSAGNPIVLSTIEYDSNSGYNTSTGQYTIPYSGYYLVGWDGNATSGTKQVQIFVNGVGSSELLENTGTSLGAAGVTIPLKLNAGDVITWVANITFATNITTQWVTSTSLSQGLLGPQGSSGGSAFAYYASTAVTTNSTDITTNAWQTFSNSPALTFTPTVSGIYKIYSNIQLETDSNTDALARIFNTSGGATLLQESQAQLGAGPAMITTCDAQSVYSLTAGTTYVFDIQGNSLAGGVTAIGNASQYFIFAEGISLKQINASYGPVTTKFGIDPATGSTSIPTSSGVPFAFPFVYYDTTASYNATSHQYTAPVTGYYDINLTSFYDGISQTDTYAFINGVNKGGRITMNTGTLGTASGGTQVFLNFGDVLTIVPDTTSSLQFLALTSSPPSGYIPTVTITLVPSSIVTLAKMSVYMTTSTTATANSPILFDTVAFDSAAAYSVGTGLFTAPSPGYYKVGANLNVNTANSDVFVQVNGGAFILLEQIIGSAATAGSTLLQLNQGDTVAIALDTTRTVNGGTAPRISIFWINQES